jgi:L-malate glycosyltransferase
LSPAVRSFDHHATRNLAPGTPLRRLGTVAPDPVGSSAEGNPVPEPEGRLRVLCLIKGLGPGGAERLLLSLALLRDRSSFDYRLAYLLPWKTALVPNFVEAGVPIECLGVEQDKDLRWARPLRRLLREGRFDVVHVHSPYAAGVARVVVRTLPRRHRPAVVSTEHNVWVGYKPLTQLLTRTTFHLGDAWLAVSDPVRDSLPPRMRRRVEVVVNGVILEDVVAQRRFRDEVREELGLAPDEVAIVTVANLTAKKGYPDLMAAARLLIDRGHPVRFVSVGQGPLEEELHERHRSMGLGDRFVFLGYHPEPTRILAGCDIFAMASHYEGLPVAIMEALAIGLPVVVTAVGGVPDAVTDDVEGLLVPPEQPGTLADALERLVLDPAIRARMAAAAAVRGQDFDMRNATARMEAIYRQHATRARR